VRASKYNSSARNGDDVPAVKLRHSRGAAGISITVAGNPMGLLLPTYQANTYAGSVPYRKLLSSQFPAAQGEFTANRSDIANVWLHLW